MASLTFIKGVALIGAFLLACGLTVEALQCYKCETSTPTDSCAINPKQVPLGGCADALGHCILRYKYYHGNKTLIHFERDCEVHVPEIFGGKTKCETEKAERTCQVVCDYDECNDVHQAQVEQCVTDDCRKDSAAAAIFISPLLIMAAIALKMLY